MDQGDGSMAARGAVGPREVDLTTITPSHHPSNPSIVEASSSAPKDSPGTATRNNTFDGAGSPMADLRRAAEAAIRLASR